MAALSPAAGGAGEYSAPIACQDLLSARTCTPCGEFCCLLGSVSPSGGDHRSLCPALQLSRRVDTGIASPRVPPALHLPPEAVAVSQEALVWGMKRRMEFPEVSVRTHVFESLSRG